MRVRVSRDSVAAGDDVESHERVVDLPDSGDLEGLVTTLLQAYQLPLIAGGSATWAICSRRPLAVVAQQWVAPRVFVWRSLSDCRVVDGVLQLYVNYFEQLDPELVAQVLQDLHLED